MNEGTVLLTAQTGRKVTLPLCLTAAGPVWPLPNTALLRTDLTMARAPVSSRVPLKLACVCTRKHLTATCVTLAASETAFVY